MLGWKELKPSIVVINNTVECPVKGCVEKVARQRVKFQRDEMFKCPKHNIYISPSTFEYPQETYNLLWINQADLRLLNWIKGVKRENRMVRDNSEDAVTWNVFRCLERNLLLESTLSSVIGFPLSTPEIMYWSYNQQEQSDWSELNKARIEFGEKIARGSEPDLIIRTKEALLFIEAKVTAPNETGPSDPANSKRYETGGNNWFSKVFQSDYKTIAIDNQRYELLRFWLLGTWLATQLNLDFYLLNLVLAEREKNIELIFRRYIREEQGRRFMRITWEDIYHQILNSDFPEIDKVKMINYFDNKTIGYNSDRRLQRAFSV
jgi:hypothetical protein